MLRLATRGLPGGTAFRRGLKIGDRSPGQDEKAHVVADQMQAIVLVALIPADPTIARRTFPSRSADHQQRRPLPAPRRHIPDGVTDLRDRAKVVMRLKQRLEARLLSDADRPQCDLFQVHAHGPVDEDGANSSLTRPECPELRAKPCAVCETGSERFRPEGAWDAVEKPKGEVRFVVW
jgi:hypothetical protein